MENRENSNRSWAVSRTQYSIDDFQDWLGTNDSLTFQTSTEKMRIVLPWTQKAQSGVGSTVRMIDLTSKTLPVAYLGRRKRGRASGVTVNEVEPSLARLYGDTRQLYQR